MNRTLLTTAAAAAGVTGVLALGPHASPATASAQSIGANTSPAPPATTDSGGSSAAPPTVTPETVTPETVTGAVAQHRFGPIQVEITVSQGAITDIQVVKEPSDGKSRWINNRAVPILISQALAAQSASIDGVSGATLTSEAFVSSLTSALNKVGL